MRKRPSYTPSLHATLVIPGGQDIAARVTDLSIDGATVETSEPVASTFHTFTLVIAESKLNLRVECEVGELRELWSKQVIHARFLRARARLYPLPARPPTRQPAPGRLSA